MKYQKRFHNGSRLKKEASSHSSQAPMDMTQKLLHAVEKTQDVEYSCGEAFQLLDQLAEIVGRGEDATQILPLVQQHLEICSDCREEFEALLRVLKASSSS
jgi:hypothetical protein